MQTKEYFSEHWQKVCLLILFFSFVNTVKKLGGREREREECQKHDH